MNGEPGVVVVTYNSAQYLDECLRSAARFGGGDIVVVDNHSTDASCEIARAAGAGLIANAENLGFAAAVNQGVRALKTETVLLLNPDARVATPLTPMVARVSGHPQVGVVGGRLLNEDGSDQEGFAVRRFPTAAALMAESLGLNRLWPSNPVNRRYRALDLDLSRSRPVEQPAGAFLLFTRSAWERLGGFDERFHPVWFEDVDFCKRAALAGYEIWYEPEVRAFHTGGHSVLELQPSDRQRFWYGNLLQYAARHFESGLVVRLVAASVWIGWGARSAVRLFGLGEVSRGVGRLAWSYLVGGKAAADRRQQKN